MEPIETYGPVQIFETVKNHFFYSFSQEALSGKQGKDLLNLFLQDDSIEEIMFVNKKPIKVYHSKYGMCNSNVTLNDSDAYSFISDVAAQSNKIINEKTPFLDSVLPDGSRINAIVPPASFDGPAITIRKFKQQIITVLDLIKYGTITPEIGAFLWTCVEGLNVKPANIIFSGGTGSGKTSNLNAFCMFTPFDSRIISIEDIAELQLMHEHLVRLIAVPENDVNMEKLLNNTLRMRPDRIIVGEVRGKEAKTLFTAMNTGHSGCMGTLHANTTQDTLLRITQEPMSVPASMLTGLDLIVMQQRFISGRSHSRHITEISEVSTGGGSPKYNTLYKWNAGKKICQKTGVPGRIREKISGAAGIPIKQFDELIKKRTGILNDAVNNNSGLKEFLDLVIENRY